MLPMLTKKSKYGLKALLLLAREHDRGPVLISELAERERIPKKFLELILLDLKHRGWSFVGPTTVYAFMQAMGLVNDHLQGCAVRAAALSARLAFEPPA